MGKGQMRPGKSAPTMQADDVKVKAGADDAMDNQARTELEASVEEKTEEMSAWKHKQS